MGVKERIEERERVRAKKQLKVKTQLKIMQDCLIKAKEEKLPTVPFMEATLTLIKALTKAELP